jgi:MFS family permease
MSQPGFRSFSPALERFFIATVINMVGSSMLFAFVFMYLDEVRGFSSSRAGLAVGMTPIAMVLTTPLAGFLSDRFGPRRVLTIGCLLSIVAGCAYIWVDAFVPALLVAMLMGVANGMWFPSQSALLTLAVPTELRPTMSAFQRTAINLGAALGGAIGGFIANVNRLASFQLLFVINVATYLVFLACLPAMPTGKVERSKAQRTSDGGFRQVFRDRFYVKLLASDLGVAFAFGFLFGVMPPFAKKIGLSESEIGLLFGLGALSVVSMQIPILRVVRGRRRMRCLSVMNAAFVLAFISTSMSVGGSHWVAIAFIAGGQILGGVGESLLGAIRQPLTSDLAPEPLIGRYFGLAAMVFQGGMGAANAVGGALMDQSLRGIWLVGGAIAFYAMIHSLILDRQIDPKLALSH